MKKQLLLLYLLLPVSIFSQQQNRFIIGAEHVSSFADFGGPLFHSNHFWDTVKSFGINYAGLKYFQKYPINPPHTYGSIPLADIITDLDKAASQNIDVYLTNGFDRDANYNNYYPKRWLYQVEEIGTNNVDFLNIFTGSNRKDVNPVVNLRALMHWDISPENLNNPNQPNYRQWIPGTDIYGIIARNLREKNLQPDGLNYYLKVRMRLPYATGFPLPDINVLTVRIKKVGGHTLSRTIKANEFTDNNWKEIPILCYYKTVNGPVDYVPYIEESTVYDFTDSLSTVQLKNYNVKPNITFTDYDIEIEWHNTAPYNYVIDLDYIAVDDETANNLYAGQFDSRIQDFADNYKNHSAIKNFMIWDEPFRANLFPVNYYNQKVQSILNSAGQLNKTPITYRAFFEVPSGFSTKQFLHETDMQNLLSDVYPIPYYDTTQIPFVIPGEAGYTSRLQSRLQSQLIPFLEDLILQSKIFNKPFLFTVQAHKWAIQQDNQLWHREPSAYEIKAMTNLAVCYGAKGINYYIYTNNSTNGTDDRIGLLDFNGDNTNPPVPRYTDAYGYPKWETVKQLNQKLATIGDELLSLTWQNAFYINNSTQPTGTYITNVQSMGDDAASTYVQLGIFKKTDDLYNQNLDHFFIVNRRTLNTDQRTIKITLDLARTGFNNWSVYEVGTANRWDVSQVDTFSTLFEPGEGKLFKIQPTIIGGTDFILTKFEK